MKSCNYSSNFSSFGLQNRNEKSYRAQIRAGIKSPNTNSNFFKPKRVKRGTLVKIPETKLKTQLDKKDST